MTTASYPIKLKSSRPFIDEFEACEYGHYEDQLALRSEGEEEAEKLTSVEICERHKTVIEIRNDDELAEIYFSLASGTIGLYKCAHANRLLDQIRDRARQIDPDLVKTWPCNNGL